MRISAHKRCGWLDRQKSVGLIKCYACRRHITAIAPAEISASFPRQRQLKKNTPPHDDVTTKIAGDRAPENVQIVHGPCTAAKATCFCPVRVNSPHKPQRGLRPFSAGLVRKRTQIQLSDASRIAVALERLCDCSKLFTVLVDAGRIFDRRNIT